MRINAANVVNAKRAQVAALSEFFSSIDFCFCIFLIFSRSRFARLIWHISAAIFIVCKLLYERVLYMYVYRFSALRVASQLSRLSENPLIDWYRYGIGYKKRGKLHWNIYYKYYYIVLFVFHSVELKYILQILLYSIVCISFSWAKEIWFHSKNYL